MLGRILRGKASSKSAKNDECSQEMAISVAPTPSRPSVHNEAMEMLTGALVIYLFADVRELAREEDSSLSLHDLDPPLTSATVLEHVQSNDEALKERALDHENLRLRLEAMRHIVEEASAAGSKEWNAVFRSSTTTVSPTVLTHFVDERANEEIVHAIAVNPKRKRITVVFRGSVTQKDFIQDAKCAQKKCM